MPPNKKEPLKDIRTSLISRGFSMAKAGLKASSLIRGGRSENWLKQIENLIGELGQLKGTAMKVGQSLSMYGEHLFPKEVTELFKTLQQNSPPLAWRPMEQVLREELRADKLALLDVEHDALAAASIGQVHRARIRETGQELALKIQYPGVAAAVDTDMKLLKFMLNMSELVPRGPRFDQIFNEIREMFYQEVDYDHELRFSQIFRDELKDDPRYRIPVTFPEFSGKRVLAMEFLNGHRIDSPEVQALSLERRNRIGRAFLELYFREFFQMHLVQTDPHLGNYLVQIDPTGENDRLVLFDFGAVREVPRLFFENYLFLVRGGVARDRRLIEQGGRRLGLLQPEDPIELVQNYVDLSLLLMEPFDAGIDYDWGDSDLPKRVAKQASKIALGFKLRAPPREQVFLDRKLAGVFIFLSLLKCKMETRDLLLKAVESARIR
jgi:predicted unusual protein kinase regulating ubiquinone biosynthesis (AarF/ABC1/UbiB family)